MGYLTVRMSPTIKQMSLDDLLSAIDFRPFVENKNETNTRTFEFVDNEIPEKYLVGVNISGMISKLREFNMRYDFLRQGIRKDLYYTFHIPKKSGGLRRIDAPQDELMRALRDLKGILENDCGALYHTSAFAYIKGRNPLMALKRHQANESRWFAKLDLSNFFGNTTYEFTMRMLSQVFPFSEIMSWDEGKAELEKAIELGFLDGGLPQGTPLSPTLTNIIMIPIDFEFNRRMRAKEGKFVCTRYADDFTISSRFDFKIDDVIRTLRETMAYFNAPYILKREKTRYGSVAGQNWNLGLMINANNEITVGHKKKREFKAMLTNFSLDMKNGKLWDLYDVQVMSGIYGYYKSIEPECIGEIVNHINQKFNVNIDSMIKAQLNGGMR